MLGVSGNKQKRVENQRRNLSNSLKKGERKDSLVEVTRRKEIENRFLEASPRLKLRRVGVGKKIRP